MKSMTQFDHSWIPDMPANPTHSSSRRTRRRKYRGAFQAHLIFGDLLCLSRDFQTVYYKSRQVYSTALENALRTSPREPRTLHSRPTHSQTPRVESCAKIGYSSVGRCDVREKLGEPSAWGVAFQVCERKKTRSLYTRFQQDLDDTRVRLEKEEQDTRRLV